MLARLDKVPGVVESRADWEGELVLIRLSPGASLDDVLAGAKSQLGSRTQRLDPESERRSLASFRRGDRWLNSKETLDMSRHEAQVLGKKFADHAGARARLTASQRQRLESLLTEEINAKFEKNHASGEGIGTTSEREWSEMEARFRVKAHDFMTAAEIDTVIKEIRSLIGVDTCGD